MSSLSLKAPMSSLSLKAKATNSDLSLSSSKVKQRQGDANFSSKVTTQEDTYIEKLKAYFNSQTSLQYRPDRPVVNFHYNVKDIGKNLEPSITKQERLSHMFKLIHEAPAASNAFEAYSLVYWAMTFVENAVFKGAGPHENRIYPPDLRTTFGLDKKGHVGLLGHGEAIVLAPNGAISIYKRESNIFTPPFKLKNPFLVKKGLNGKLVDLRPSLLERLKNLLNWVKMWFQKILSGLGNIFKN
jgi:hypothetical protein